MEKAGRPHWAGRGRGLRDRKARGARLAIRVAFLRMAPFAGGLPKRPKGPPRLYAAQGEPFGLLPKAVVRELRGAHQA